MGNIKLLSYLSDYNLQTMSRLVSSLMLLSLMVMVVTVNTKAWPGESCPPGQISTWRHYGSEWTCRDEDKMCPDGDVFDTEKWVCMRGKRDLGPRPCLVECQCTTAVLKEFCYKNCDKCKERQWGKK